MFDPIPSQTLADNETRHVVVLTSTGKKSCCGLVVGADRQNDRHTGRMTLTDKVTSRAAWSRLKAKQIIISTILMLLGHQYK